MKSPCDLTETDLQSEVADVMNMPVNQLTEEINARFKALRAEQFRREGGGKPR